MSLKKRVLVVGGAGYLGSNILNQLLKVENIEPICADLVDSKIQAVTSIKLDLLSKDSEVLLTKAKPNLIINCSGQITRPSGICFDLNTTGISHLINVALNTNVPFVQVSTLAIYGSQDSPLELNTSWQPESVYGSSKAFAEYLLTSKIKSQNLSIYRLSNLYGGDQPKGIMSYLIKSFNSNTNLNFNNDGSMTRNYLHVEDASRVIADAASSFIIGGNNIVGNDQFTIKELVAMCHEISGKKEISVSYTNDKPWENIFEFGSTGRMQDVQFNNDLYAYLKLKLQQV